MFIPLAMIMASCGGGGGSSAPQTTQPPATAPVAEGLLIEVESQNQLLERVRQGFTQVATNNVAKAGTVELGDGVALDAESSAPASSDSFTTTYTLEANVDEHD